MKISVSNTFDVSSVANSKSYQELQDYFEYSNKFTSDVVDALTNKLTLKDNLKYSEQTLSVTHGVATNIGAVSFSHLLLRSTVPILAYSIVQNKAADYILTIYFKQAQNALAISATWVAGTTVRYKVQNVSNYGIGESITFSNFGTATNNGTYIISSVDVTNNYVYVQNHNRTSSTGDESRTSYAGTSQVKNTVILGILS